MDQPKRKHRATGQKPPGGARPGAGRPSGTLNALDYGAVKALRVSRLRVPEGAPEAHGFLADTALGRIIDVMMEQVTGPDAGNVLKAATRIREEVCGPLAQKHEVAGEGGGPLVVEIREYRDGEDA